ncbi:MAG: hypothetical protein HQ502_09010 [Alphaproteobacteria bacterium]|nr:hypothetical protein [Alphaproteobacteria bacterium]
MRPAVAGRSWAGFPRTLVLVALAGLLLSGCASVSHIPLRLLAMRPAMPDFMKKDCETESGARIYRQVDKVDGYLDSTTNGCDIWLCQDLLRERRAKYIEARADRADVNDLVPGPGYYRFTLQRQGDPRCAPFERFLQETYRERLSENAGICIATEQIDKPISRYEITKEKRTTKTEDGEYIKTTWRIIDRPTGYLIFTYTGFYLSHNSCDLKPDDIGPTEFLIGPRLGRDRE